MICYSCFLTEEPSPQTRKEPDLEKEDKKRKCAVASTHPQTHIITCMHTDAHTQCSLPSDDCHINLAYVAYSNYDYGNKSSQCVPRHIEALLKGELGQVQRTISSHSTMSQPSPHSPEKIFPPKGNRIFCKTCEI